MKLFVSVFESTKREGVYAFVKRDEGLKALPEDLRKRFGKGRHSMDLVLTPERKLARIDGDALLKHLEEDGYYLQMPAYEVSDMLTPDKVGNSKLS